MAIDRPISKWRNFASWSVAGGAMVIAFAMAVTWVMRGNPLDLFSRSAADPRVLLALLVSMLLVGLSSLNRRFDWRGLSYFVIASVVSGTIAVAVIEGFRPLARAGTFGAMGASHWAAEAAGLVLLFFAGVIGVVTAAARRGWTMLDADQIETLRERGRLTLLAGASMATMGAMLVLLGLSGPGSVVTPATALAGALALLAVTILLSMIAWRGMDELDRTLSYETGHLGFYLVLLVGGGWALLAHLGFVSGPAPLDWLTLFAVLTYAASFIVLGRRKLLTQ